MREREIIRVSKNGGIVGFREILGWGFWKNVVAAAVAVVVVEEEREGPLDLLGKGRLIWDRGGNVGDREPLVFDKHAIGGLM